MTAPVYNGEGKEVGTAELPAFLFDVQWNGDLVHQVMTSQLANRTQGTAHTKTRGEVSGGGRKPWRQKGTGRARHGSNRSPIWTGGGVTFGPRAGKTVKKINVKMRRKALRVVLSAKARDKEVIVVEELGFQEPKTKTITGFLTMLPSDRRRTLIALPELQRQFIRAANNIPYAATCQAKDLNVLDLLGAQYLILPKKSIQILEETLKA